MSPAQACKKLRAQMGAEAFRAACAANCNGANAFGKCVSRMARVKNDAGRAVAVSGIVRDAERCVQRETDGTRKGGGHGHGMAKGKVKGKGAQTKLAACLRKAV
jgi:hypothetical protein